MENKENKETCFMQSQENARYDFINFMRVNDFIAIQEIIGYLYFNFFIFFLFKRK